MNEFKNFATTVVSAYVGYKTYKITLGVLRNIL